MPPFEEIKERYKTVSENALQRVAIKLGKSSIEDPTPEVVRGPFRRVSDDLRRYLLEQHYWPFAETMESLSRYPGTPPSGYSFLYNFPPEFISMTYANDSGVLFEGLRGWDIVNGKIAANFSPFHLSYTSDVKDETLMNPSFFEAWCLCIAKEICLEVTRDKDLKDSLAVDFAAMKMQSIEVSFRNDGRETIDNTQYLETRIGVLGSIGDFDSVLIPETPIDLGKVVGPNGNSE